MKFFSWFTRSANTSSPDIASKPWLKHPPWAEPEIRCSTLGGLKFIWFFSVCWCALSAPVLFVIPEELAQGNRAILIALLFPLVGLAMLVWAVALTRSWRRFGSVAVRLDPYPGAIGGQVGGSLDLRLPYNSDYRFPVVLSCVYSFISGSGKNRSRKERLIWQARGFAYSSAGNMGTRLNFRFDVPADLPAAEPPATQYHLWRLELSADLPGADLKRQFELPVFPTGESSRFQQRDSVEHPDAAEHREMLIESVLKIRQIDGGVELYFPPLRHWGMKLGLLVFGLVFGGAAVGMSYAKDAPGFMVIIFGLVGGVMLAVSVYGLFNSLSVRLDRTGIASERRWLGIPIVRRSAQRSQVQALQIQTSYSQQTGGEHIDVCALRALLHDGKTIVIAESLKGRDTALQAMESIALLSGYEFKK